MSLIQEGDKKITTSSAYKYSSDYKQKIFVLWYNSGKPSASRLFDLITEPESITGKFPSKSVLQKWISEEFTAEAIFLDEESSQEIEKRLVTDKVEMLLRHAKIGRGMQEKALSYLEENDDLGNARTAITLLVEGLKVERESTGVVPAQKYSRMTDDELLEKLKEFTVKSPLISVKPNES